MLWRKRARVWTLAGGSLFVTFAAALLVGGDSAAPLAQGAMIGCTLPLDPQSAAYPIVTAVKRDVDASTDADRYFAPLTPPPKTQAALDQVGEIEWVDLPLESAIDWLSETAGVEFLISPSGLEEEAVTPDVELTFRSKSLTYGRALRAALVELDLDYVLYDDYVLITSRETADTIVDTRMYALEDHPLLRRFEEGQLVKAICDHVDPEAWPQFGGTGSSHVSLMPGALVVTATQKTHDRVEALLAQYARVLAEYDPAEPEVGPDPFGDPAGGFGGRTVGPGASGGGFQ